jgi:hypothetical protein
MVSAERLMVELSSTTSMRMGDGAALPFIFSALCSSVINPSLVIRPDKGAFMHPNVNTPKLILFGRDVLVYHFRLQFPVLTTAYGKKLRILCSVLISRPLDIYLKRMLE